LVSRRKVTFEKLSEDENGAVYHVEALHVGVTRNQRKYSKEELTLGARSLSYRPINLNHQEDRWLPYNFTNPTAADSNTTLNMEFVPEKNGVIGEVWVSDKTTRENIDNGNIKTVSIEQLPTKGESCSCMLKECTCEQQGIIFTGIALLETFKGVEPGDPNASIKKKESTGETVKAAISWLQKAIDLHQAHMDGTEPTSDASQMRLMDQMKKALAALKEQENAVPPNGESKKEEEPMKFKCEKCGMDFDSKEMTDDHMKQVHDPKEQAERIRRQFLEAVERESLKLIKAN